MNDVEPPRVSPQVVLLRIPEAARLYPIGNQRLRRLIKTGEIAAVRMRGELRQRVLVTPEAIESWLRAQEQAIDETAL